VRGPAHRRGALGALLVLLALLAVPAAAAAQSGLDLSFQLEASNGYKVTVGGYDATAFVKASRSGRSPRRSAWSTYVARGKVSPTSIRASFGRLGSAAMRFRPSGRVTHSRRHRGCIGPDRYTIRLGVFVGSVHFRGEGGYTTASAHRVKGKIITPRLLLCRDTFFDLSRQESRTHAAGKPAKVTRFEAYFRSGLTAMVFAADRRPGKAGFLAETEQSLGSLAVFRGAFVRASPKTFSFDSRLSSAGVMPPAPFSGSAAFQRGPSGAKSWTGSLAVSFPGAPDVSLTDPRFKTQLTRSW
jgi:hypothetical protein